MLHVFVTDETTASIIRKGNGIKSNLAEIYQLYTPTTDEFFLRLQLHAPDVSFADFILPIALSSNAIIPRIQPADE